MSTTIAPNTRYLPLLVLLLLAPHDARATKSVANDKSLPIKRSLGAAVISDSSITNAIAAGPWSSTLGGGIGAGGSPIRWSSGGSFGGYSLGNPWNSGWNTHSTTQLHGSPSPSEVANAIAAAKQASANVLIAQQQMQAAKENALNQQRLAMEKETAATILTQKSEAAAAIQRSEAAAAAQSVVLAQQRLAASKAAVAHQQRIAAAREAEAAAALQRSAHAAAAEIQKTEYEAAKFGQYTRNGNAGAAHHLTLTKDAAFSPITAGTNHVPNLESFGPWASILSASGGAGAAMSGKGPAGTAWL